jgi:hypothetical protein
MPKIEAEKGELVLQSENGDVAIIPAKYRYEALGMVEDECWKCLNDLINSLPVMEDYAEDGTLIPQNSKKKVVNPDQPVELEEFQVKAEAPKWLKYKQEYEANTPFNIDKYVEDRYNNPVGREAIYKINEKKWKADLKKEGITNRENSALDYTAEKLIKEHPENMSRVDWLNSLSDKEEELVKRNKKYQPSLWDESKRGLQSATELNLASTIKNIADSKDFSNREKLEMLREYQDNPIVAKLDDTAKILSATEVPGKIVQALYKDDYSLEDAVTGKQNDAGLLEQVLTEIPADMLGVGLFTKLNKLKKAGKLTGLPKSKLLDIINTPDLSDVNLKEMASKGKGTASDEIVDANAKFAKNNKSEINWGKWNKEIPENKQLMKEYEAIEQQTKADGTWMKNPDGSDFNGPEELFIQSQSKNWVNAYGEKGLRPIERVYRGMPNDNPLLLNKEGYTGVFSGNKDLAKGYGNNPYELAMKNSDNSVIFNALKDDWLDLNFANRNIDLYKKNIELNKKHLKKLKEKNGNPDLIKNTEKNIKDLEKALVQNTKTNENPHFKKMVEHFKGKSNVSTDDVAQYLEKEGLDNIQIKNVLDGAFGNINISNQVPGNYLKSLTGNNGMFDMTNPNIYKTIPPLTAGYQMSDKEGNFNNEFGEDKEAAIKFGEGN